MTRYSHPLRWALTRLAICAVVGALLGPVAGWLDPPTKLTPVASPGVMALGMSVLLTVMGGIVIVPLAFLGYFQQPPEVDEVAAEKPVERGPSVLQPLQVFRFFIIAFALLGLLGGLLDPVIRTSPTPVSPVAMAITMGLIGLFPGAFWLFLERGIERSNPENPERAIQAARRRAALWTGIGFLGLGVVGAVGMAFLVLAFNNKPISLTHPHALEAVWIVGFLGGGMWGGILGGTLAILRNFLRKP